MILEPEVFETISRMSALTGQSRSRIVGELLESVHDPLMRTVSLLEAAAAAPVQVRKGLKDQAEKLERQISDSYAESLSQLDILRDSLGSDD